MARKHISSPAPAREKQSLFLFERLRRLVVGRPVDLLVGDVDDPFDKDGVKIVEATELFAPQEALDVLDPALDLALGLGSVRTRGTRPEAVIPAEVPENRVPLEPRAFEVPAEHYRLHVVVDDLMVRPAQELEGLLVGTQEGGHLLVGRGDGERLPTKNQGHDEQMNLGFFPATIVQHWPQSAWPWTPGGVSNRIVASWNASARSGLMNRLTTL